MQNLLIVFTNGLIEIGAFAMRELAVAIGFITVWQFSRWELAYDHDLSVGIGPEEEIL